MPPIRLNKSELQPDPSAKYRAEDGAGCYGLLTSTLQLAVPLWIERLRTARWEYIQERAKVCSDFIGKHGDNILFRSKKKGDSATAFNHLAEGLACLSFCPGGVKIFGSHWEACLSGDIPNRSKETLQKLLESLLAALKSKPEETK